MNFASHFDGDVLVDVVITDLLFSSLFPLPHPHSSPFPPLATLPRAVHPPMLGDTHPHATSFPPSTLDDTSQDGTVLEDVETSAGLWSLFSPRLLLNYLAVTQPLKADAGITGQVYHSLSPKPPLI